jgi:general secretion pathway protein A
VYESYFGLSERPFDLSPNPRFLFLSRRHSEALAHLRYGMSGRPGITVLIGEAGTGKTTLVRAALQPATKGDPAPTGIVHLTNPTLTRNEFYEYLANGFGLSPAASQSKPRFLSELESILERPHNGRAAIALIADEAQSLPHELLEEIRLLTNIQSKTGQSLAVALVGQPELAARLNEDRLRQLKQRVALRCELTPLDLQETASYIATRIKVAGGRPELLFTRDAIASTYEYSRGIPRTISVICDSALVNGFATDFKPVGRDIVIEVCRDFELKPSAAAPKPATAPPAKKAVVSREQSVPVEKKVPAVVNDQPAAPAKPQKTLFGAFQRRKRFLIF